MSENDHDLLIELNTKVSILIQQQSDFTRASTALVTGLAERISALETKDSRDSEKVRAIDVNVQRSLQNHEKITTLQNENVALRTELDNLIEEVGKLQNKANLWDIANSVGVAIAGVIGYFVK